MSTAKRSKRRQGESQPRSASPLPASKRLKSTHVPAKSGLEFLVDDDARSGKKLDAKLTNGAPRSKSTRVDESHPGLAPDTDQDSEDEGDKPEPEVIAISSGEEESSDLEEDEDFEHKAPEEPRLLMNGHVKDEKVLADTIAGAEDEEMVDAGDEEPEGQPSFGELLQTRHPEPIDVQKSLQEGDQDAGGLVPMSGESMLQAGHSLGTVLSQALKNNDKDLLETCFALTDLQGIRATIQRQKSHDIATLLERIAERIHRRPGRTGNLMVWIQWSLVSHGGYLANQPELMKKLKSLAQVVRERAAGLQPLLHLKGKLDLLSAQLELRRGMQDASRAMNADNLDDPKGVLYIEGQDQDESDSDVVADEDRQGKPPRRQKTIQSRAAEDESEADDMDAAIPDGIVQDEDDEGSEDDDDADGDDMLDLEAEEDSDNEEGSSNEEAESEEEDDDHDGNSEDEESEIEAAKPPKPNTLNRKR